MQKKSPSFPHRGPPLVILPARTEPNDHQSPENGTEALLAHPQPSSGEVGPPLPPLLPVQETRTLSGAADPSRNGREGRGHRRSWASSGSFFAQFTRTPFHPHERRDNSSPPRGRSHPRSATTRRGQQRSGTDRRGRVDRLPQQCMGREHHFHFHQRRHILALVLSP